MQYPQAINYLNSLEKFGINLGLSRIKELLKRLGNPQLQLKCIHIGGTNGKGSTAAMIASILKEAGYKVGLYTSPHLLDFTERFQVNGKEISRKELAKQIELVKKAVQRMERKDRPTVFEVLTAVAFLHFTKNKVDYAVLEAGMGGRLDATNVVVPTVSVITNVDYDHMDYLGKSLGEIAFEKCGIIKEGIPVVTAESKGEPLKIIRRVCKKKGVLLIKVEGGDLKTGLIGKHQKVNAACAIAAIRLAGIKVSKKAIVSGLRRVRWPGRFQILSKKPLIIIDGAHNPAGVKVLKAALSEKFGRKKFCVIFGCQKTKDFRKMYEDLSPVATEIVLTRSSNDQAQRAGLIFRAVRKNKIAGTTNSLPETIAYWNKRDPLLITGSLFLVADALKHFCS